MAMSAENIEARQHTLEEEYAWRKIRTQEEGAVKKYVREEEYMNMSQWSIRTHKKERAVKKYGREDVYKYTSQLAICTWIIRASRRLYEYVETCHTYTRREWIRTRTKSIRIRHSVTNEPWVDTYAKSTSIRILRRKSYIKNTNAPWIIT
jgi:hypothetical protein